MKNKILAIAIAVLLITNTTTAVMLYCSKADASTEKTSYVVQVQNEKRLAVYSTYEENGLLFISKGDENEESFESGSIEIGHTSIYLNVDSTWELSVELYFETQDDYAQLNEIFNIDDLGELSELSIKLNEEKLTTTPGLISGGTSKSVVTLIYEIDDKLLSDIQENSLEITFLNTKFEIELTPVWGYSEIGSDKMYSAIIYANSVGADEEFDNYKSDEVFSDLYKSEPDINALEEYT